MNEQELLNSKYWNELLQVLTCDENFKIRKTEMEALMKTEVVEFYQNLTFFEKSVDEKVKRLKAKQ